MDNPILTIDENAVVEFLSKEFAFSPLSPAIRDCGKYKGWKINHNIFRPISGRFVAERYGVTINANNLELLKKMIDGRDSF